MKHISLVLVMAVTLFASCRKITQPKYSCDPQLNQWVKNNFARVSNFTRADLAAVHSPDSQMATYRSLTNEHKCNLWKDKLSLAKSLYEMSAPEQNHVDKLINYLQPAMFEDSVTLSGLNMMGQNWANEAKTTFGWDDGKIFLLAETWLTEDELLVYHNENAAAPNTSGGIDMPLAPPPGCSCRSSLGCGWFWQSCRRITCGAGGGCGITGSSNCIGLCESNWTPTQPNPEELPTWKKAK